MRRKIQKKKWDLLLSTSNIKKAKNFIFPSTCTTEIFKSTYRILSLLSVKKSLISFSNPSLASFSKVLIFV